MLGVQRFICELNDVELSLRQVFTGRLLSLANRRLENMSQIPGLGAKSMQALACTGLSPDNLNWQLAADLLVNEAPVIKASEVLGADYPYGKLVWKVRRHLGIDTLIEVSRG